MSAKDKVVAVTGGAGFIGSHTVEHLLSLGCRVVVLDNFRTGSRANLSFLPEDASLRVVESNVSDGLWPVLAPIEEEWGGVDAMIHLAAQTSVVYSMNNPMDDIRNTYTSTAQVLEYARNKKVKTVVFASSAAVYGDVNVERVDESIRPAPMSPYGIHKMASETLMQVYSQFHGVATRPLRFFNVYGPRQDPRSPYAGVISLFVKRALRNEPLTIFGDGEQTRDFVYVGDVARALALACFAEGGVGEPLNIGTGRTTTINELASLLRELCGSSSDIVHLDARAGEIRHSCADVEGAREALSFSADVKVRQGLAQTIDWLRSSS